MKDTNMIYERAHSSDEPIFVTKNGYGALVVMSIESYERHFAAAEVRRKLKEAEDELAVGAVPVDAKAALDELRKKYAE
ncbi:MAG: type II toxin-antitoxin system Phd/YefM family antitoxin [Clostridiales bacterium]|nr:type II toxin-antitoxin system Phd/YefM family antitoxin [Clostridiales bacterium]